MTVLRPNGLRTRHRSGDVSLCRLANSLVLARNHAGLTQEQVAYRMGTTKSAVSRLESGKRNRPNLTTIENYALVVGCRVDISLKPFP